MSTAVKDQLEPNIVGTIKLGLYNPRTRKFRVKHEQHNLFLKSGADLLASLLVGASNLGIRGMYLEFDNDVGVPVEPTFDRDSNISYYTNSLGATRDFLRVPLASQPILSATDATYSANKASFFAITSTLTGLNGEQDFQSGSQVYGGALIATPDLADPSRDFIVCRTYWAADAVQKDANHQVAVHWSLTII